MRFKKFLKDIPLVDLKGMDLCSIISFEKKLLSLNKKELYVLDESYILAPYYILNNQIYELYEFDLYISNEFMDVYSYLENKAVNTIENISQDIIDRTKKCFISVYNNNEYNIYQELKNYLEFITNSQEFSNRVEEAYNQKFNKQNIYFEIY